MATKRHYRRSAASRSIAKSLIADLRREAKAFKRSISTLKKLGLISKRFTHVRTKAAEKKVKSLREVLSGRAVVRKAPVSVRTSYKGQYKSVNKKLIIPKYTEGERISVNKKTGKVHRNRTVFKGTENEIRISAYVMPSRDDEMTDLPPNAPGRMFTIRVAGHRSYMRSVMRQEVLDYVQKYDDSAFRSGIVEIVVEQIQRRKQSRENAA